VLYLKEHCSVTVIG